jgi:hypothetical protein
MSTFERLLGLFASIITIFNLFFTLPVGYYDHHAISDIVISLQSLGGPTRVLILIIFECSLAYFFGYLAGIAAKEGSAISWLLFVVISTFSSYVTLYNIESIILAKLPQDLGEYCLLAFFMIAAFIPTGTFMWKHVYDGKNDNMATGCVGIQLITYFLMFFSSVMR